MKNSISVLLVFFVLLLSSCTSSAPQGSMMGGGPGRDAPPPPPMMGGGPGGDAPPPLPMMGGGPGGDAPFPPPMMGRGRNGGMPPLPLKWWRQSDIVKQLNLSSRQAEQIDAIAVKGKKDEIKLRSEVELSQVELEDLMDQDRIDMKQAETLIDNFVRLHADLEKQRMTMLLQMRNVLTRDQHLKLQQILMGKMELSVPGPKGR